MAIKYQWGTIGGVLLGAMVLFTGCKKDKIDYEVPTTYNFENVSFAGQTDRLNMLTELSAYMKSANVQGTVLDAQVMNDMFSNSNNPFSFTSTRQLKDKCHSGEALLMESWFDSLAQASQSTVNGANGIAGVVVSGDGSKKYLCSANGYDWAQVITKTMMGAVLYYQATGVYLTDSKIGNSVDNETITAGEGTDMEHHWDEAFGYLGVAKDFPSNEAGAIFWGDYCLERNPVVGCSTPLMNAFIKGRAAISHEDYETRDEQATTVKEWWEKIAVASAIHYMNAAKSHLGDDALRNHELSEGYGFVRSLRFNPTKKISDTEIQTVLGYLGSNFYEVTLNDLDAARNLLSSVYGMDAIKDNL